MPSRIRLLLLVSLRRPWFRTIPSPHRVLPDPGGLRVPGGQEALKVMAAARRATRVAGRRHRRVTQLQVAIMLHRRRVSHPPLIRRRNAILLPVAKRTIGTTAGNQKRTRDVSRLLIGSLQSPRGVATVHTDRLASDEGCFFTRVVDDRVSDIFRQTPATHWDDC